MDEPSSIEKFEFDYYKDDYCHNCKFAVRKEDGTFGAFSRRYGCICPERLDFRTRASFAKDYITVGAYTDAIQLLNKIVDDQVEKEKHGWLEPVFPPCFFRKLKSKNQEGETSNE